ncbi:MAG: GreA/GreB family elongation factor [Verrucomicrobiota bacterium]|nr:GreA/GreB family elongation factor [Verrucomicrobiota bacterium]
MNKEAIDLLIHQHPALKTSRDKLESMKPGAYVIHRAWGMGQIKEYDAKKNRLIIDFEDGKGGHPMDPAFCVDKVDVLSNKNILVRQKQSPGLIEELAKSNPCDVIVEILSHMPDQSASMAEIERLLNRLLGETEAKKYWASTKKLLVKEPRVQVPAKKTDPYVLREEPVKAEDEILEDFFQTKAPKKKIALASKLLEMSVKHEDIKETLPDILKSLATSLIESKALNRGERLFGIWVRNDLARFIHEDVDSLQPTSASLLKETLDLNELAVAIPGTHHTRYLNLIERTFPETWTDIHFDLLKNSSGKFTGEVISYLLEKDFHDRLKETLERWLIEHTLKGPVIMWIIKNRNTRRFSKMLSGMIAPKLLNAILYAIDYEALQNASTRRIPLAELLGDDPELITELLAEATPDTAQDLAMALLLNQGFDELSKKSLLARFIKLFPRLQSLVSEGSINQRAKSLMVTKESYIARKAEYDNLVNVLIPENKQAIATAREHGDLRENAEYKMARQDQEILMSRKSQLEIDLARSVQTDFADATVDAVSAGSVVELRTHSTGAVLTYTILGAWDSNPEKLILSYQTPLADQLITKKVGDSVSIDVDGHLEQYTIQSIKRWVDMPKA